MTCSKQPIVDVWRPLVVFLFSVKMSQDVLHKICTNTSKAGYDKIDSRLVVRLASLLFLLHRCKIVVNLTL